MDGINQIWRQTKLGIMGRNNRLGVALIELQFPLEDEDIFIFRNFTICWRTIAFAVEFRIVRLILLKHIVDSRKERLGNGDDGFFVTPAR